MKQYALRKRSINLRNKVFAFYSYTALGFEFSQIWVFTNLGSDKIVRIYIRPPLRVSWGEILHFKQGGPFGGKLRAHQDF